MICDSFSRAHTKFSYYMLYSQRASLSLSFEHLQIGTRVAWQMFNQQIHSSFICVSLIRTLDGIGNVTKWCVAIEM